MKKTAANKKVHDRQFDAGGKLLRETRGYLEANGSRLAILLMREYKAGRVIGETDIVKGRVVSRRSYDKARVNFPPMPAPNTSIEDRNARLLRTMAAERRSRHDAAKAHVRHRQRGREPRRFLSLAHARRRRRRTPSHGSRRADDTLCETGRACEPTTRRATGEACGRRHSLPGRSIATMRGSPGQHTSSSKLLVRGPRHVQVPRHTCVRPPLGAPGPHRRCRRRPAGYIWATQAPRTLAASSRCSGRRSRGRARIRIHHWCRLLIAFMKNVPEM